MSEKNAQLRLIHKKRKLNWWIVRPNQIWSTDITNVRLAHGFVFQVAIIECIAVNRQIISI